MSDPADLPAQRTSIRGAAVWAMAGQYFSFAAQFAASVIISRFFLLPQEVGLFSIALAAAMMVSVLQDFGLTRYLSGHPALDDKELQTCASLSWLLSLLIAGSVALLAWPVAQFYHEPRLTAILALIAASYLFNPWSAVPAAMMSRNLDFKALFLVNAGGAAVNASTALILAWKGFSAESLAIAMVAQAATRAVIAQALRPIRIPFVPQLTGSGAAMRFGAGSTALCLSGSVGVRSPDLVIGRILGLASAGLYSRSSALAAQLHMLVVGAIGSIFYPAFARLRDEGQPLGPHYERVVAGYGAVVWPAMALLAALAEPVIMLLYGPIWREAAPLLVWMALGEICFVMLPLHIDLPILMGEMKRVIRYNLLDTAAAIGSLVIFAFWGIHAAAVSRLVYGFLWVGIYARFMHGIVGFDWPRMLGIYARSACLAAATAAPALLSYWLWRSPAELGFSGMVAVSALGGVCWLAMLNVVRHPAREELLSFIRHVVPARLQPMFG